MSTILKGTHWVQLSDESFLPIPISLVIIGNIILSGSIRRN